VKRLPHFSDDVSLTIISIESPAYSNVLFDDFKNERSAALVGRHLRRAQFRVRFTFRNYGLTQRILYPSPRALGIIQPSPTSSVLSQFMAHALGPLALVVHALPNVPTLSKVPLINLAPEYGKIKKLLNPWKIMVSSS
jgi:hypothetical protein